MRPMCSHEGRMPRQDERTRVLPMLEAEVRLQRGRGKQERKRVVVEMPQQRVGQEPDEEWMRAPPLTRIMEALEEWVLGQKEIIKEMECIQMGYDAQREDDQKWREEEREWREEQRKWRREDREEGKKKIYKKDVRVQVEEEEDKNSSLESDDESEDEEKKE